MRKKLKIVVAVIFCIGLMAIIAASELIRTAAKGRTYSDVSLIPYRRVGILLGCSRQLPDGRQNLFKHIISLAKKLGSF
jgi:vancomycin permeability regulator SanA